MHKKVTNFEKTILLVVVSFSLIGMLYALKKNSVEKMTHSFEEAIRKEDIAAFKKVCSTYSDGSSITDKEIKLFFKSLDKNDLKNQTERLLSNDKNFVINNKENRFNRKTISPKKRFFSIESTDDMILTLDGKVLDQKKRVPLYQANTSGHSRPYQKNLVQ
ncbi:TcaA second domain-containing protein [Enterococcus sp. AZ128]|uniref:TcaA second domain-containing protein n=1 Tax=unclassified Enterococcus TaxID=2608891 RepID=UPI003F685E8C